MKIAILLATYNGEKYLAAQIESILSQDYTDWVLYISDDCSTDGTIEIIDIYCSKYPEKIFCINKVKRFGNPRDNFFYLLIKVNADVFFLSDQDDVWAIDKISTFIRVYNDISTEEKQKPLLIHSNLEIVNADLKQISPSFFKYQNINYRKNKINTLLVQNIVHGCAILINNELKSRLRLENLDEDNKKKIEMHDWYFALIAAEFGTIKYINKTLVKYRQHQYNNVGTRKMYTIKRIKKSLMDIKNNKSSIKRGISFASVMINIYEEALSLNTYKILNEMINLDNQNKFNKIRFLVKNGMLQHGFIRIIKQLLFV
jgi:glycosyltransferase involved in cell wall biosynthesis